jgi:hypothetical protein
MKYYLAHVKNWIQVLVLVVLILVFCYVLYPKKTVHYSPSGGSLLPFGETISVSKCYGLSKGITNKWVEEYRIRNGDPSFILRENDYCIGIFFPHYGVTTSHGFDVDIFK